MVILYVETNFPVGIAKGQDPQADALLTLPLHRVHLVMPSVCFMEALSTWNREKKQREKFVNDLKYQIREAQRDITSHASTMLLHLKQSQIEHEALLNDIKARLEQALRQLSQKAEMVPLTAAIIEENFRTVLIDDPTDNLILHCILAHTRHHLTETKAFLSSNVRDFDQPEVHSALSDAGIEKWFRTAQAALGWVQSLPDS